MYPLCKFLIVKLCLKEFHIVLANYLKGDIAIFVFLERFKLLQGGKAGRTSLNKYQQRKIIKKHADGISISKIARKLDLSRGTVTRFINNPKSN